MLYAAVYDKDDGFVWRESAFERTSVTYSSTPKGEPEDLMKKQEEIIKREKLPF